jgi:membrane associated rhomboid family serine protease
MLRRTRGTAWVTWVLVGLDLAVYALELRAGDSLDGLVSRWGLVPADLAAIWQGGPGATPAALVTLVTSQFLHAGWIHLLVNLAYLSVFGAGVERSLGWRRYLALYLLSGIGGGLAFVWTQSDVVEPALGASGAIAGVIAAYLVLLPGATLGALAPVLFFHSAANVPALLLLAFWLLAQFFNGVASITSTSSAAGWAHAGGFLCGALLAPLLRPRRRRW